MFARDFRAWARDALRGHWGTAIAVALVGSLLGGGIDLVSNASGASINLDTMEIETTQVGLLNFISRDVWAMLVTITIVTALLALVIGGAVTLGMVTFNLNLLNRREARFSDLFSQFHRLWAGFRMNFIMNLFVFLWSLLFVIPGIIAAYRYTMVPYLMAEFPDLGVMDAMRESKRLMKGNKWRLFCLQLSFIGWELLGALTMGIGYLWLNPYRLTSETAFYMEVTGRGQRYGAQQTNPYGETF